MIWIAYPEPTLDEMLSDSIIQAVMAADHVDPRTLRATLRQVSNGLPHPAQLPTVHVQPAGVHLP
jgi:hypothetical protein